MFTEKILQMTGNPVVLAEQKLTVPTERLVRALRISELLSLSLVNLTYLGAPFVDPKRGDFDALKPRILTAGGLVAPCLSKDRFGQITHLVTIGGLSIVEFYKQVALTKVADFRLSLEQIKWLLSPQEFDMTEFYLRVSGLEVPTKSSISAQYLPRYYEELGRAEIPVISDYDRLAGSSKRLVDQFDVQVIDLPDLDPQLDCSTPLDFSERSYIDLSMTDFNQLHLN